MPEITQNKLKFLVYLRKYGQNNILKVLENPPAAFQEIQDGVQSGRISILLTRSICPLEVGRVKDFGHREPNATLGRRRGGGTLEVSADGVDSAIGGGCCRTSTVDRCLCMEQRARGDLNG